MKQTSKFYLSLLLGCSVLSASAQSSLNALVDDGVENSGFHQGFNYYSFLDRAPTGWTCYLAGDGGVLNGVTYLGMDWDIGWIPPFTGTVSNPDMIRMAADQGFKIVMAYVGADNDASYYAATNGCVVFTKDGAASCTFIGVRNGYSTNTVPNDGGACELFDAVDDFQFAPRSFAHSATAAKYARLLMLHPTWNVFDLRQALRQTATFYATGWREDRGYGFPMVTNRMGTAYTNATINGKSLADIELSDLDAGPPLGVRADISSDGHQVVFRWYPYRQTDFASTVVKVGGTTIYDGDGMSYTWTPTVAGRTTAEFYTKLSDNRLSPSVGYARVVLKGLTTEAPSVALPSCGEWSNNGFSFVVSGPQDSYWDVFASSDLLGWQQIGGVTLNSSPQEFGENVTGLTNRFYRLSDGTNCSRIIGFARLQSQTGWTAIANPFDVSADDDVVQNTLGAVFAQTDLPAGAVVLKAGVSNVWNGGTWSGSSTLSPGEGAHIHNNTTNALTLTLAGYVREGQWTNSLMNPLASGAQAFVSSVIPWTGGLTSALDYHPHTGDLFRRWSVGLQNWVDDMVYADAADTYDLFDVSGPSGWYDSGGSLITLDPIVGLGQPFVIDNQSGSWSHATNDTWIQNLEVCSGTVTLQPPSVFELDAINIGTNSGYMDVWMSGTKGSRWSVYWSGDLIDWTYAGETTFDSEGAGEFLDQDVGAATNRFYKFSKAGVCSQVAGFSQVTIQPGYTAIANPFDMSADHNPAWNRLSAVFGEFSCTGTGSSTCIRREMSDGSLPLPAGTQVLKMTGSTVTSNFWNGSTWSDANATLSPGDGAFLRNTSSIPFKVTFAGVVREGQWTNSAMNPLSPGSTAVVSSIVPKHGGLTGVLEYQPHTGDIFRHWSVSVQNWVDDMVYVAAADTYNVFDVSGPSGWYDYEGSLITFDPVVEVAESFSIANQSSMWSQATNDFWSQTFDACQ